MLDSKITAETRAEAGKIFEGMEQIVRNEMLIRGVYITEYVANPALAESGAICGGHQACMVGSMWLAAGIKPRWFDEDGYRYFELPGTSVGDMRQNFLEAHPALKLAYDTMNSLSERFPVNNGACPWMMGSSRAGAMENLFEGYDYEGKPLVTDAQLLDMLERAKGVVA